MSGHGSTFSFRAMQRGDVPAAAALHREVFRDHFLGHMTQRFLEIFYGDFVVRRGAYSFVAVEGDRIVGVVIGSTNLTRLFNDLYRRHFVALGWQVTLQVLRDGYVRRNVAARTPHVLSAIRNRFRIGRPAAPDPDAWPPAQLLSIGLADSARGSGVAEELTRIFCQKLAADGVDAAGLSVRAANLRAIAFYEKTGWTRLRTGVDSVSYVRRLRS